MILKTTMYFSFMLIGAMVFGSAYAQVGDSPFERDFGDVKFLDAYFGTSEQKLEVSPGDRNVPFTVVLANVGTQDITGIKGQLSLPFGFTPSDGPGSLVLADAESNSLAGDVFTLTFFVNIGEQVEIKQYPGSVKVDYSRLRESGLRNAVHSFDFKVTGDSVINVRAVDPFLTSLRTNDVIIEIANDGTAPISGVDIVATNTETAIASTSTSITNVENVVILDTDWDVGHISPQNAKYLTASVYVPESLKGETLRVPLSITYFNAHGDQHTIDRIVDFYIKGLIDTRIYNVDVIDLSGLNTVVGEIINEGNEDALFGFVTLEPMGDSNIKTTTQFIDEIEIDSPVPFNIPIEFDGEPKYGEHDIKVTARYKDSIREETFVSYETTITVPDTSVDEQAGPDMSQLIILPVAIGIGIFVIMKIKKRKKSIE